MKKFELIKTENLYQGFFRMEALHIRHELFNGGMSPVLVRERMVRPAAVCVLLFDPLKDVLVLIEQFRAPATDIGNPWLIELVAGLMDKPDEDPGEVARRESEEEAGLTVKRLHKIYSYWSSPGASSEYIHLYVGEVDAGADISYHGLEHEGEDIRAFKVTPEELKRLLADGRICNAAALIAVQWFIMNVHQLKEDWLSS